MPDDALRAVAELAAAQHGAISRRQAAHRGFAHHRVATARRRGWLREPVPGVLVVTTHADSWRQRVTIETLSGRGPCAASHRAAAHLHGLDGFDRPPIPEISTIRSHRLRPVTGAIVHHIATLPPQDLVRIDGIACTGLARTLADLGSVVDDPLVVRRALSDARRRNISLGWLRSTAERLHRPGQRGTGVLLGYLDEIAHEGRVPESWFEELLARCLADPDLPPVIPQYDLVDRDGRFVARLDLAIPAARLGIEGHSRRFHFGPDAEPLDEQRDMAVAACGWELLYLGWNATTRPAEVLGSVKRVVAARMCVDGASEPSR